MVIFNSYVSHYQRVVLIWNLVAKFMGIKGETFLGQAQLTIPSADHRSVLLVIIVFALLSRSSAGLQEIPSGNLT